MLVEPNQHWRCLLRKHWIIMKHSGHWFCKKALMMRVTTCEVLCRNPSSYLFSSLHKSTAFWDFSLFNPFESLTVCPWNTFSLHLHKHISTIAGAERHLKLCEGSLSTGVFTAPPPIAQISPESFADAPKGPSGKGCVLFRSQTQVWLAGSN